MGYNFPDEVVAQSRALILLGYSGERIAKELPKLLPGENIPAERTIQVWAKELRETALEEIRDAEVSISRRMDTIIHDYLDKIEDGVIKPSFSQVMLGWGLSHDKVTRTQELQIKSRQTEAGQALAEAMNRLAGLSLPQLHDIIEGESREISPGDNGSDSAP